MKKAGKLPSKTDPKVAQPYFVRGGKTLAEIVNKANEPPKPKAPKLNPLAKPISIRDFPIKHKSLAGVLKELEENAADIDKLKRPGEKWAFQVDGIRSYRTFEDIGLFVQEMLDSAGIQQVLKKRQASQELYNSLKLVRWNKTATEWKPKMQHRKPPSHAARQAKSRAKKKGK